ncbi:hypothetical protein F5X98DRAFT_266811 [Xylaria grammica]|nr:hypothetical protein F5X98DRAFT_266811 [Xylaria grammica]
MRLRRSCWLSALIRQGSWDYVKAARNGVFMLSDGLHGNIMRCEETKSRTVAANTRIEGPKYVAVLVGIQVSLSLPPCTCSQQGHDSKQLFLWICVRSTADESRYAYSHES